MSIADARDPWQTFAACRDQDPGIFDPPEGYHVAQSADRIAHAITICGRCPVAAECAAEAKRNRDSGVRGGVLLSAGKPVPRQGVRGPDPLPCGTYAAYKRHLRHGTPTCEPCKAAYADRRTVDRVRGAA